MYGSVVSCGKTHMLWKRQWVMCCEKTEVVWLKQLNLFSLSPLKQLLNVSFISIHRKEESWKSKEGSIVLWKLYYTRVAAWFYPFSWLFAFGCNSKSWTEHSLSMWLRLHLFFTKFDNQNKTWRWWVIAGIRFSGLAFCIIIHYKTIYSAKKER